MFASVLLLVAISLVDANSPADAPAAQQQVVLLPIEQELLDKTNAERARHGLPAVAVDPSLQETCRKHCAWMARSHRMVHGNYHCAEIIAAGQRTSAEAISAWMRSSGHRRIMLGRYTRVGVAAYVASSGQVFWAEQYR